MTIVLDADALAPRDRAEAIRTLIWDTVVRVEIEHHPDPTQISATGRISEASRLNVCSIRSNATTVTRTAKLAHESDDQYLFLGLQLSGSSMVVQDDREAVLRPGDLAVYDTRRPYTLVNAAGIHQHFFRIPVSDLTLPGRVLQAVTAIRFGGDRPLAKITAGHLREVAKNLGQLNGQEAEDVAEPTFALIRAMLASQIDDLPDARQHLDRSLELRIIRYIRTHLHEHDLSAGRIAVEHHISVRHLYRLLGRSDIVLGDWIRRLRLEACRRALADPGDTRTITAVAHQWGFVDMTHFGRAFKATYGMSPRDWRATNRAAGSSNRLLTSVANLARAAEDSSP
ncbi:helix-turn-helix domain-containing protein [Nocardioides aestuarii]|uniref:Helix-turn-helix domain-containing protein n=1 Tax=Nocardioides aestuarii TaxID=252231 RepID=A0ABW4TKI8_9ACTN